MIKVAMMHPFDPRGNKVGGLETYTRDFIRFHPNDLDVLLIGVDGKGDLELGKITKLNLFGREFYFLPVLFYPDSDVHQAASSVLKSITFNFAISLIKYFGVISRTLRSGYSVDLRRSEFSFMCVLNRIPFIQMLHGEGAPKLRMDSLLKKYRFAHNFNEAFAMKFCKRFLCVNPFITDRIRNKYPSYEKKISTLTTWFNPNIFYPTSFNIDDGVFKIVFCGRLDAFKVPELMFKTIAGLMKAIGEDNVEFHYIGTSDPDRFSEFNDIRHRTILHGFQDADGISEIHRYMHAGILTSEYEGMPRATLETLGSGRPVVAINLPQLEPVVIDGVSGYLVSRDTDELMEENLINKFIVLRNQIFDGEIDPSSVASKVNDYTPEILLGKVYSYHREIHAGISCEKK